MPASNIEIRPAVLADAARIRDLTRAAYAKWVALIGREPLPMQADYQRAVAEHTIDLLIDDGALAGLIETILRPDHLWIENVAVAPEQQGRGFGRLLLAHAEKRAVEAERLDIRLLTNQAFTAVRFRRDQSITGAKARLRIRSVAARPCRRFMHCDNRPCGNARIEH